MFSYFRIDFIFSKVRKKKRKSFFIIFLYDIKLGLICKIMKIKHTFFTVSETIDIRYNDESEQCHYNL